MADELHVKGKDLKDLKVVELKKELAERGLTITGNKSDLVARLEEYILKQGDEQEEIEVEVGVFDNEIEPIGGEFEQEISEDTYDEQEGSSGPESKIEQLGKKVDVQTENIPPPEAEVSKIVLNRDDKITEDADDVKKVPLELAKTDSERKVDRQQRFGIPLSDKQKKLARAERFGIDSKNKTGNQKLSVGSTKSSLDLEKLSRRAERFGAVSPHVTKIAEEERIKKRKERFGLTTSGLSVDAEARKKMRAERFKLA